MFFLLLRLLFPLISLPIFNEYRRLLFNFLILWTVAPPVREPTATPLFGRPYMLRRLRPPTSEHLHLKEAFLLILDEPLKLLPHLDLVGELTRHLRVREKGGAHRLRGFRGVILGLHDQLVVFEGARLQVGDVNFPSFSALCAGV